LSVPTDISPGQHAFTATAVNNGVESGLSNEVTFTISCAPTIIQPPSTITDCTINFAVSGTSPVGTESINLYKKDAQNQLTLLGSDNNIDQNGDWSVVLDPNDQNLGEGTFTLVAKAVINNVESAESNTVTLSINCPLVQPTITAPSTITDCVNTFDISGTSEAGTTITLFKKVGQTLTQLDGTATTDQNGDWTITLDPNDSNLGEGTFTLVVTASKQGETDVTSAEVTLTINCPTPPSNPPPSNPPPSNPPPSNPPPSNPPPSNPPPSNPPAPAAPAAPAPAAGIPVQIIDRQIFQRPYATLGCNQSVVELKKDLIPTTDFPSLVNETISKYHVTVLNVYNTPDYKAMLLAEGDEKKVLNDPRFLLAAATCGEMILELVPDLVPTTNIFTVADDAVETYHVKVVDVFNMTNYKAIAILAEPDNPITKDPRFVHYGEEYQAASNYTGGGELDVSSGHIAAPAPVLKEETIPDSIKRTFTTKDIKGNSNFSKGVDVDIAVLDTGIDLKHPDLNVYRNVSFIPGVKTGDDDNGHGTHVAGIAAAKDNGKGVIGAAPGARLWAIKACDSAGECKISNMIKAVEYITQHADEIDVVNISVETPFSPALNAAISASVKAGVTYVVAAGNYGQDASKTSPASDPDVITVSAITDSDGKCGGTGPSLKNATDDSFAHFSNFGPAVTIAAPGVAILSTYLHGGYAIDSGTSMAAPSVAGAAALLKAGDLKMSPEDVKKALLETGSTPLTPCVGGPKGYFTGDPDQYKEPLLYRKLGNK